MRINITVNQANNPIRKSEFQQVSWFGIRIRAIEEWTFCVLSGEEDNAHFQIKRLVNWEIIKKIIRSSKWIKYVLKGISGLESTEFGLGTVYGDVVV